MKVYINRSKYNDFFDSEECHNGSLDEDENDHMIEGPSSWDFLKLSTGCIFLELSQAPFYNILVSNMAQKSRYPDVVPYNG